MPIVGGKYTKSYKPHQRKRWRRVAQMKESQRRAVMAAIAERLAKKGANLKGKTIVLHQSTQRALPSIRKHGINRDKATEVDRWLVPKDRYHYFAPSDQMDYLKGLNFTKRVMHTRKDGGVKVIVKQPPVYAVAVPTKTLRKHSREYFDKRIGWRKTKAGLKVPDKSRYARELLLKHKVSKKNLVLVRSDEAEKLFEIAWKKRVAKKKARDTWYA